MFPKLEVYPKIIQKRFWIPILIFGALIILGGLDEGAGISQVTLFMGLLIIAFVLFKLATKQKKLFKMDEYGLLTPEFGFIPWSDIKDLSWTVEKLPSGGQPMPEKWKKMIVMHIDVHNRQTYWQRMSRYQKYLHKGNKKVKHKQDRLMKNLKHYNLDQEEIVRRACLLFYEYKREIATLCVRAKIDPAAQ